MTITELHTYPIKGMRGIAHNGIAVEARGLSGDRRWMMVDEDYRFISQREFAGLASISVAHNGEGLTLTLPGLAPFPVAVPDGTARKDVKVWNDSISAALADGDANFRLSEFFDKTVYLVFMDDLAVRPADPEWIARDAVVSFADSFPILITNTASLDDLNAHIEAAGDGPVPMARFRPNIVVDGPAAWDEDGWQMVKIGGKVFDAVKPCSRCIVTTRDQNTGAKTHNEQPIRTLNQMRRSGDERAGGVLFGWYLVPREPGRINIGDDFKVVERRLKPWRLAGDLPVRTRNPINLGPNS